MAKKSTKTQFDESPAHKPALSDVHQRAREAVEALKAVRDELQRQAAELDERQIEIQKQLLHHDEHQARISREQVALDDERERFQAEHESSKAMAVRHEQEMAQKDEQLAAFKAELASLEAQLQEQQAFSSGEAMIDEPELVEAPRGAVEVVPIGSAAGPKSAGTTGSASARKLRRNTKRKAIGI